MRGLERPELLVCENFLTNVFLGVYGLECYKTQELYFELEMAKWNVGKNESKNPESICSKPCPMGQIKNFEVFNMCCKNLPELRE